LHSDNTFHIQMSVLPRVRNQVTAQTVRGFESHPVRHKP
jgi:hypothetical protein